MLAEVAAGVPEVVIALAGICELVIVALLFVFLTKR